MFLFLSNLLLLWLSRVCMMYMMRALGPRMLQRACRGQTVIWWSQFSPSILMCVTGIELRSPGLHSKPLYLVSLLAGPLSHISEGETETIICSHSGLRLPGAGVRIFVLLPGTPLQRQGL